MVRNATKKARCLHRQPEFSRLDKSRSFFLLSLTILVLLFMGASIFYISTHVRVVGIGYEINQSLAKKQNLIEENKRLSLEIAQLKSPTRIEEYASNRLDLIQPKSGQIVFLSDFENSTYWKTPEEVKEAAQAPPPKTAPKVTKAPPSNKALKSKPEKKLIIARILRENTKVSNSKPHKKSKESPPAILLDPMP